MLFQCTLLLDRTMVFLSYVKKLRNLKQTKLKKQMDILKYKNSTDQHDYVSIHQMSNGDKVKYFIDFRTANSHCKRENLDLYKSTYCVSQSTFI